MKEPNGTLAISQFRERSIITCVSTGCSTRLVAHHSWLHILRIDCYYAGCFYVRRSHLLVGGANICSLLRRFHTGYENQQRPVHLRNWTNQYSHFRSRKSSNTKYIHKCDPQSYYFWEQRMVSFITHEWMESCTFYRSNVIIVILSMQWCISTNIWKRGPTGWWGSFEDVAKIPEKKSLFKYYRYL